MIDHQIDVASTSHPGVAPGVRSTSVAGCEDATVSERSIGFDHIGFNRRSILKIATWNCGGLSFTTRELCKDLQYDILVLTETHNNGDLSSSKNFIQSEQAPTSDSYSGVAILLSDRVAKCVSHTGCVGSRIVYATIRSKPCNLFIIGVYMPHKMRKEKPLPADTMLQLEEILAKVHPHDCIILLGDLNCKLGRFINKRTGRWSMHKHSDAEGKQFLSLMQKFNLTATSTCFQPRRCKLGNATFIPRNPEFIPTQIDYTLTSTRWATSTKSCKVKWGVSYARWGRLYDHGLVECQFKARLKANRAEPPKDFSVLRKDNEIRQEFDKLVSSTLTKQPFDKECTSASFRNLCSSIETATAVLPKKKRLPIRKRHVSAATKRLHADRQTKFAQMSRDDQIAATHAISNSIRNDYVSYIDGILSDMEAADRVGNTRELMRLRKTLSGKNNASSTMPSKDSNGDHILSQNSLMKAWKEFLTENFC